MRSLIDSILSKVFPIQLEYLVEILIIYTIIYVFLRFLEGTRGEGILKGIALLIFTVPILATLVAEKFKILDVCSSSSSSSVRRPSPSSSSSSSPS